ncbi:helix-turn-helix domain-containing protein, partial [Nocardia gipuzkoensis]
MDELPERVVARVQKQWRAQVLGQLPSERAIVVMASAQRQPVPAIARLMQVSEAYVRQVIHEFNERGFEALDPKWSAGRPRKVDRATRERIACIARCCPLDLGWPFSVWSLSKLREVLLTN